MIDLKKIEYSIKGTYWSKPIIRYFYIPFAKILLYFIAIFNLPICLINGFNLILTIIGVLIILIYPKFIIFAGIILFFSFVMDIVSNAWAKYNGKISLYQRWIDETNGVIRIAIIFLAGTIATYNLNGDYFIFILSLLAIFSYMMMVYSGAIIEFLMYKHQQKEDISNVLKKSLGKKNKWLIKSPISFSFEYQYSLIVLLTALNKFAILFLIFIIFCTLKWVQGYFMVARTKE